MRLRWGGKTASAITLGISIALSITATLSGLSRALEHMVENIRFSVLAHDGSGTLVVVEMDAASVARIEQWPWPRENYAQAVRRLKALGASSVVFDVDFSSRSNPAGDAAFADALKDADGLVVLPTFGQQAGSGDKRSIDTVPLPMFQPHAALASVSIAPDEDGVVRTAPLGTFTGGLPRPSLSAYIAARAGAADDIFQIDYSIRPQSIPRISFAALRDGQVDARLVLNKTVLIGATAIEMGDRYATPSHGVLPGVIVQALAAETLIGEVPVTGSSMMILLLAALLATPIVTRKHGTAIAVIAVNMGIIQTAIILFIEKVTVYVFPLAPGLLLLAIATGAAAIRVSLSRFHEQRIFDEVTGLPNQRAMVAAGMAGTRAHLAVAELTNLDGICAVLGHNIIADLVKAMAERLKLAARGGEIYRVGNKHLAFTIDQGADLEDVLQGLRAVLRQPLKVAGKRVDVATVIGVAWPDASGIEAALSKAIVAAERAMAQGQFWAEAHANLAELERSISLMGELDEALGREEIYCFYQPKYSLTQNRIVGVEALARWNHPQRGHIRPDHFILLAEQSGRISQLTLYLMRQAIDDVILWQAEGHNVAVAVNISAKLLNNLAFKDEVLKLLGCSPLPLTSLTFEVTESATLDDPAMAAEILTEFRSLGITISMDDYGTGQSTLSYLRTLPLGELKIDKSFVENAHRNRNDAVMVRSTIDLAHDLGLKVVAEGVEEEECLNFLRSVGCDVVQGYLISRPISCDQLMLLLDGPGDKILVA